MDIVKKPNAHDDLYLLLGKSEDQIQLINDLKHSKSKEERKDFKSCSYLNYKEDGISFCFSNGMLDSIFLYNDKNKDGYKRFQKIALPHSLTWEMNNADVVKMLGEPEGKPTKGGVIPIYVDYQDLGLQIDFLSPNYEEKENPITTICIYPPKE